jgi:HPt (histidine-containing phosphotransfer) domain-containing protein
MIHLVHEADAGYHFVPTMVGESSEQLPRELVQWYVGEFPHLRRSIQSHFDQDQPVDLQELLHKLKGSGTVYGFPEITELASQAERKLRIARSTREATAEVTALTRLLQKSWPEDH